MADRTLEVGAWRCLHWRRAMLSRLGSGHGDEVVCGIGRVACRHLAVPQRAKARAEDSETAMFVSWPVLR